MSFSADVKKEIVSREVTKSCCVVAAAYAVACFGKYFDEKGTVLHTEHEAVAKYAKKMMHRAGIEGDILIKARENKDVYEFAVKEQTQIDKMLDIFGRKSGEVALRINGDMLKCEQCVSTFIAAAFLCAGTMTNPEKEYNLEILSNRYGLIKDLASLLEGREITTGCTRRKGCNVLYIKSSEQIEDLLTIMGATGASLEIMNLKVYKDIRNKANRIANCETANIDKTVTANVNTSAAISYLRENGAFELLPDALKEAALLLEENPDASLRSLAQKFNPPISKSGLSHRLKKLESIAENMKERSRNG